MEAFFERLAHAATRWSGSTAATVLAIFVIGIWVIGGFVVGFGTDYQMYVNTGTTIVTFIMVFLIQRSQNKDSQAVHLKLNELVAAVHGASNRLINVEDLSESEIALLHKHFKRLGELAKHEETLTESHSIEEAQGRHRKKQTERKK
ncbi:MAG TPA: low affinity iron permease family protein [Gemmataceae bacterium]|nr:low affinity iron permease family protein [Gemmataceae bacterium]